MTRADSVDAETSAGNNNEYIPEIPDALPILPLIDIVVVPMAVAPISIGQQRSIELVDEVMRTNRLVALVAQRDREARLVGPDDIYHVG
jgi:ATP-dependent Lon protease